MWHNKVTKQLKRPDHVQGLNQYSAQDGMKDVEFLDECPVRLWKKLMSKKTEKH